MLGLIERVTGKQQQKSYYVVSILEAKVAKDCSNGDRGYRGGCDGNCGGGIDDQEPIRRKT